MAKTKRSTAAAVEDLAKKLAAALAKPKCDRLLHWPDSSPPCADCAARPPVPGALTATVVKKSDGVTYMVVKKSDEQ